MWRGHVAARRSPGRRSSDPPRRKLRDFVPLCHSLRLSREGLTQGRDQSSWRFEIAHPPAGVPGERSLCALQSLEGRRAAEAGFGEVG